jgi:hypothetical protein
VLDPIRKTTLPAIVDGFLESRLTSDDQTRLRRVFNGARA